MASSKSTEIHKIPKVDEDLISSLPTELTDNILKFLPLESIAQMSVLSKKWRQNWLSHRYLVFDEEFWERRRTNGEITWQKINNIINNILFHHIGPIHEFNLYIPEDVDQVIGSIGLSVSQWLSFLSRIGIKKISLRNMYDRIPMPSHIFTCTNLEELRIMQCQLMHPPTDFKGFACLQFLELFLAETQHIDTFGSLLANCPRLKTLILGCAIPASLLNIDVPPGLEHLGLAGHVECFESFAFKDVPHLKSISLHLYQPKNSISKEKINSISNFLIASSSELEGLSFTRDSCQLLAAGGITKRFNLAFSHLVMLHLENLDLVDFEVFCFTIGMLQRSPFIKDLKISVSSKRSVVQHNYDFNDDFKLGCLRKAVIKNIKGTTAELKFIKYLLAISVVLRKLFLQCSNLNCSSKLKVSQELLKFPRASTKAKVVILKQ